MPFGERRFFYDDAFAGHACGRIKLSGPGGNPAELRGKAGEREF